MTEHGSADGCGTLKMFHGMVDSCSMQDRVLIPDSDSRKKEVD